MKAGVLLKRSEAFEVCSGNIHIYGISPIYEYDWGGG